MTADFRTLGATIVELWDADCDIDVEISELRELLATPPPEPVAYIHRQGNYWEPSERVLQDEEKERGWIEEPLYAAPPLPKPLTDEAILALAEEHEICYICLSGGVFYKFIEGTDMRDSVNMVRAVLERWG